jgi:hypothetical protein
MNKYPIVFTVRVTLEELEILKFLMQKYGGGWPIPQNPSERFRMILRNIDKRPFEHVLDAEEEDEDDEDEYEDENE